MRNVLKILEGGASGPSPRYADCDVMHVLAVIRMYRDRGMRAGRRRISEETGIGAGTVRSILQKMASLGLVDIYGTGTTLTASGSEIAEGTGISLVRLGHTEAAVGTHQVTVAVRNGADAVTNGAVQRNEGLKAGGDGCTAIIVKNGDLIMPPVWNVDERYPVLARGLREQGVSEGDLFLIGGSDTGKQYAAAAAFAAALAIL